MLGTVLGLVLGIISINGVYLIIANVKNTMRNTYLAFVILLGIPYLFCNNVYCQSYNESIPQQDKNAIYFSTPSAVLWHGDCSTFKERSKKIYSIKTSVHS